MARAYAACFSVAPPPAEFFAYRDRLLAGTVTQTGLLREFVASVGDSRLSGLRRQALHEIWSRIAFPLAMTALLAARARLRNILRLPRNLRAQIGARKIRTLAAMPRKDQRYANPALPFLGCRRKKKAARSAFTPAWKRR